MDWDEIGVVCLHTGLAAVCLLLENTIDSFNSVTGYDEEKEAIRGAFGTLAKVYENLEKDIRGRVEE